MVFNVGIMMAISAVLLIWAEPLIRLFIQDQASVAFGVSYLRTIATQLCYWPQLFRELKRADVVHVFSASYFSFLLAPLPAVLVVRAPPWRKRPAPPLAARRAHPPRSAAAPRLP